MESNMSQPDPQDQQLYQIWVDDNHPKLGKREIPIGPRMLKKFLEPLMEQINRFIIDGKEKQWRNPRLVKVFKLSHGSPFTREDRANDRVGAHREETISESLISL
jgi:hypothetical protein